MTENSESDRIADLRRKLDQLPFVEREAAIAALPHEDRAALVAGGLEELDGVAPDERLKDGEDTVRLQGARRRRLMASKLEVAEGIEVRHARACATHGGGGCDCKPSYRVHVWSNRERKRLRQDVLGPFYGEALASGRDCRATSWRDVR